MRSSRARALMQRLPAWARWSTITGKVLIGLLVAATVVTLWVLVSIEQRRPVVYDDDHRALQVRFDRQRARRFAAAPGRRRAAAVLGVQGAAVDLPREAARRLRIGRPLHRARDGICRSASRAAGVSASIRSDSTAPSAIPAPCATRLTRRRASCLGMPCASARPPGPGQVRPRVLARQPADAGKRAGARRRDGRRRAVAVRAPAAALRPGGSAEDAGARICATGSRRCSSDRVPPWGRGRVDTFNPYKAIQFNWPLDRLPPSELIGATDYPSLVEPGAARRHAAALGRRQRLGGRAQPQRGARRRRDAGHRRSRGDQARARLDLDAAAAQISVSRSIRRSRAARRAAVRGSTARTAMPTTGSATA